MFRQSTTVYLGAGERHSILGAFTADEWAQEGDEFKDDYIAGRYDRACERCGGSGKVRVADLARMSDADRAAYAKQRADDADVREIERQERAAEEWAERRFG